MIGQKWKCGDTWSGLILIGRGLILIFLDVSLISRFSFERIVDSFTFDNEKQDEEIRR